MTTPYAAPLAQALECLLAHDWHAAHVLVQELDDPIGWRIHGLVHRVQGDLPNSRYWYEKAGVTLDEARSIEDEINELRDYLGSSHQP